MNKKIKKLWVDALKSGKYKQGKGRLYNSEQNKFCCLGVLCDLHAKSKKKKITFNDKDKYLGNIHLLPKAVIRWAEFEQEKVRNFGGSNYDVSIEGTYFGSLNDEDKLSFKQIAKKIEKNL